MPPDENTAPKTIIDRIEGDLKRMEQAQDSLQHRLKELKQSVRDLEGKIPGGCTATEAIYLDRREVMISVSGSVLRFVEIRPSAPVTIGLDEARASELFREAQAQSSEPLMPWLLRSVPAVRREVPFFLLQDRLVEPRLYELLVNGAVANEVSYEDARQFIGTLNRLCDGVAQFDLPSEEELVAVAKLVYDPARNGLIPCTALAHRGKTIQVDQLLGHSWQLTRSACKPLSKRATEPCPGGSFVRKGGTSKSENALECIPEYRSAARPTVRQKDTSFRLVLRHLP
ncbi:MAG: hypothetical protein SX243_06325 [Acidobacteriota bacterium]|nr:hypothetical protein [Acidobacteriota bacterium]